MIPEAKLDKPVELISAYAPPVKFKAPFEYVTDPEGILMRAFAPAFPAAILVQTVSLVGLDAPP